MVDCVVVLVLIALMSAHEHGFSSAVEVLTLVGGIEVS